ncbi:hypothetical protein FQN53_003645 [Emmonsiellopsis sp. PD_33]|nr:hypothetical protein FQN53_003645 [Emmonsiellopsis sp. PD_33]
MSLVRYILALLLALLVSRAPGAIFTSSAATAGNNPPAAIISAAAPAATCAAPRAITCAPATVTTTITTTITTTTTGGGGPPEWVTKWLPLVQMVRAGLETLAIWGIGVLLLIGWFKGWFGA